jgi:hypothetical protein
MPESFNTNISHQLFDYKIPLRIRSNGTKNQKVIFQFKTGFKR